MFSHEKVSHILHDVLILIKFLQFETADFYELVHLEKGFNENWLESFSMFKYSVHAHLIIEGVLVLHK